MIDKFADEYEFLSNFYPAKIVDNFGLVYPTVEHYFQAMKVNGAEERFQFVHLKTPGKAKRLGRAVTLREDWEEIKDEVMLTAVRQKFKDPELAAKLLATKNEPLMEGNTWHDNYWGNCFCEDCANITGKNKLGKILMQVRTELQEGKGE